MKNRVPIVTMPSEEKAAEIRRKVKARKEEWLREQATKKKPPILAATK